MQKKKKSPILPEIKHCEPRVLHYLHENSRKSYDYLLPTNFKIAPIDLNCPCTMMTVMSNYR